MDSFENSFAGFIASCTKLHDLLVPVAVMILLASFVFFYWGTPQHPMEQVKFVVKLFLILLLINDAGPLINGAQQVIQNFVTNNVDASPDKVAQRYKDKLAAAEGDSSVADQSWWDMLFSANFFEALIYAALLLVSWLAMVLVFYIYIFQKVVLLLCWVLSPPLFACFAIPLVSGLAMRHCLRVLGILTWPLGLALASCVTDGLIDMQTDQNFFFGGDANVAVGAASYVLVNLLSIAAVGLWILFSSVLAPVAMQRLFGGGSGAAGMIPRAAQLLANDGPAATRRIVSYLAHSRPAQRQDSHHESPPSLIKVEPPPSSPVESPSIRPVQADDPTAENAVRQAMDETDNSKLV